MPVPTRGRTGSEVGLSAALFHQTEGSAMRNRIDIDHVHSQAIVREIGERLRASLKLEPELPASLKMQIDRLRELEEQSPSIIPGVERWDMPRR